MNKRRVKKELNKSNFKVQSIKLDKDETLVIGADYKTFNCDQLKHMLEYLQGQFPNNRVIMIPNNFKITKIKENNFTKSLGTYTDLNVSNNKFFKGYQPQYYFKTQDNKSICDGCGTNPKNGGSGNCNCTLVTPKIMC